MRSFFPRDVLAEFERLQNEARRPPGQNPSIRGYGRQGFPALNIGTTSETVEIIAFAPGLDAEHIEVLVERGVLSISGERLPPPPPPGDGTLHIDERFAGPFRRVVSLPDDADPDAIEATYRDGVLHVCIRRRQSSLPRRIAVQ